jgi:hypothetical protein
MSVGGCRVVGDDVKLEVPLSRGPVPPERDPSRVGADGLGAWPTSPVEWSGPLCTFAQCGVDLRPYGRPMRGRRVRFTQPVASS